MKRDKDDMSDKVNKMSKRYVLTCMQYSKKNRTCSLKLSILAWTLLSVMGCQPNPENVDLDKEQVTADNQVVNQTTESDPSSVGDSKDEANKQSIRRSVIEELAGVPMSKLATFDPQEIKQGGDTGITITSSESYSKPSSNITASRKGNFFIGNAFFKQPWVEAPSSTNSRDGLGALFNVAACQSCHIKDGRGHAPIDSEDSADSLLIRLAMPAVTAEQKAILANSDAEKIAHPLYGGQLQDRAIQGVPAEAKISITWTDEPVTFADGHVVTLRRPDFKLVNAGYGKFDDELMVSPRVALPMIGLGLLEYIPSDDIKRQADVEDSDNDGISGKYNWVIDPETGKKALGKFGWKAGQTRLITQNMSAFNEDMGLTSRIRPNESCIRTQKECVEAVTGAEDQGDGLKVEVSDEIAVFVEFYTQNLAVPNRRDADDPMVLAGKKHFYDIGCQNCHTPRYQLPMPVGANKDNHLEQHGQTIYPYTDLLLHDMGDDLADRTIAGNLPSKQAQVEFLANSYEWRTPALWGIGLAQTVDKQATFLHDGRARTLMEAVLWHGGEAEKQKQQVLQLDETGRAEFDAFLNSL